MVTDHYLPWAAFHSEVPAALAGLLAVAATLRRSSRVRLPWPAMVLLLAATIPWCQWAAGQVSFAGDALLASLYLAGAALCVCAGCTADEAERKQMLEAAAVAVLAGAMLTTAVLAYQWTGLRGLNQVLVAEGMAGTRATGNLGQPNHAATLLCLGLASVVLMRANGALGDVSSAIVAGYLVLGLALTQSRVPWLAFVFVSAWLALRHRALWAGLRLPVIAVPALIAAYLLLFWLIGVLSSHWYGVHPTTVAGSRLGLGLRPVLYGQWAEALRASPWVGFGWLQGRHAQAVGALARPGTEPSDYAHSLPLDLLAWNGLPLGTALVVLAGLWYLRCGSQVQGPTQWFRFTALTVLLAHSLVEYPFAYAYFLVPIALLTGQMTAELSTRTFETHRVWLGVLTVLSALGVTAIVRDYLRVESDIRVLREQNARIGAPHRSEPVRDIWVLDQMAALSRASRIEPRPGMPGSDLKDLEAAASRFANVWLLHRSALALALNGQEHEARDDMRRVCAIYGQPVYDAVVSRMGMSTSVHHAAARDFIASLRTSPLQGEVDRARPRCLAD